MKVFFFQTITIYNHAIIKYLKLQLADEELRLVEHQKRIFKHILKQFFFFTKIALVSPKSIKDQPPKSLYRRV